MDFVNGVHPDMPLMSFSEMNVQTDRESDGDGRYFVPKSSFVSEILENYKSTSVAKLANRVATPFGIVDVPRRLKANTKYIVVGDIIETLVSASAL